MANNHIRKMIFPGTYEQLRDSIRRSGIDGEWKDLGNQKQFRTTTGSVLNFWVSTRTVYFQGRQPEQVRTAYLESV